MKKVLYTLAALSFVFVACNKQEIVPEEGTSQEGELTTVTIKASNGDADTKAAISDGLAFTWTTGDKIAVHTDAGLFYESEGLDSGGITADFTVSLSGTRDGYAVYPASVAKSWSESTLTLTLPNTYTYAQVSGDNTPLPMIATNTGATLNFYHVGALVRLTVPGIPATADKLVITFDKDVTGDFTLASPVVGSSSSAITTSSNTGKNVVTITLTPGTDYSGAVINIPVPTVTGENKLSITSVVAQYGTTPTTIETVSADLSNWSATRAYGKKATATFTPSMLGVILSPGNVYTSGGNLYMASNYYSHAYAISSTDDFDLTDSDKYNVENRTHFNFNETYWLMNGTKPTMEQANANVGTEPSANLPMTRSDFGDGKTWRVSTWDDWTKLVGYSRPGTTLNGTPGYRYVTAVVSGMGTSGTSTEEATAADKDAFKGSAPSTNFQAGLLVFPDNVVLSGVFDALGTKNVATAEYKTTKITKDNLDKLIAAGCAFLPSVGGASTGGPIRVGYSANYWSSTTANTPYAESHAHGFLVFSLDQVNYNATAGKKGNFRTVRLVRDLN